LRLQRVTGCVVNSLKFEQHEGTFAELETAYHAAQSHSRRLGWWGIPGPYWTLVSLAMNRVEFNGVKKRAGVTEG
jgi:hypothetical protein